MTLSSAYKKKRGWIKKEKGEEIYQQERREIQENFFADTSFPHLDEDLYEQLRK